MPYENGWYVGNRIAFQRIYGNVTIEDLQQNLQSTLVLIDTGTPPVHVISDLREIVKFPMNVNQLKEVFQLPERPNMGWTVIITNNALLRFFTSIIVQIARTNYKIVTSYEDAVDLLRRIDPTLGELLPIKQSGLDQN
jgi:hypothetical protein